MSTGQNEHQSIHPQNTTILLKQTVRSASSKSNDHIVTQVNRYRNQGAMGACAPSHVFSLCQPKVIKSCCKTGALALCLNYLKNLGEGITGHMGNMERLAMVSHVTHA